MKGIKSLSFVDKLVLNLLKKNGEEKEWLIQKEYHLLN